MLKILAALIIIFSINIVQSHEPDKNKYKQGFISITQLHPLIIINLKYVHSNNILNKNAPGYNSSEALLTHDAAQALFDVQEYLSTKGFSLVIYDAYHPYKTYKTFEEWALEPEHQDTKNIYHPNITKSKLIENGYIKNKLDHTRGSTVDVTIIPLNKKIQHPCTTKKINYKNVGDLLYVDDGTVNMGSSHDCFHPISSHDSDLIEQSAKENRFLLKEAMENHGFVANDKVWWQYKLAREPFVDSNFDFDT